MIIKIQIALNVRPKRALVYNRERTVLEEFDPVPPRILDLIGNRPKAYFAASIAQGQLIIGAEVSAQDW